VTGPSVTLFVVTATFAMIGALITISARRPLRGAMGLLVNIVSLAGMFLTLNAHLLAALQLLVYAGAIVVLFVFVIMLLGSAAEVAPADGRFASRTLGIASTFSRSRARWPTSTHLGKRCRTVSGRSRALGWLSTGKRWCRSR